MLPELFQTRLHTTALPLSEERELIIASQDGDKDATWRLLTQYAGLLQVTANRARASVAMTSEQTEDLESSLVLRTLEVINEFDLNKFMRLSQVLPQALKEVTSAMVTALAVPRGTLSRWFRIWKAGNGDITSATELAPSMGMRAETFQAIAYGLEHAQSEWVTIPYSAGKPTADAETYKIAHLALSMLTGAEREVIELAYGFRGDAMSDQAVGEVLEQPRSSVSTKRERALSKMQAGLTPA